MGRPTILKNRPRKVLGGVPDLHEARAVVADDAVAVAERRGHGWLPRRRACKAPARAARAVSRLLASERERGRVSLAGLLRAQCVPLPQGLGQIRASAGASGCKTLASRFVLGFLSQHRKIGGVTPRRSCHHQRAINEALARLVPAPRHQQGDPHVDGMGMLRPTSLESAPPPPPTIDRPRSNGQRSAGWMRIGRRARQKELPCFHGAPALKFAQARRSATRR